MFGLGKFWDKSPSRFENFENFKIFKKRTRAIYPKSPSKLCDNQHKLPLLKKNKCSYITICGSLIAENTGVFLILNEGKS